MLCAIHIIILKTSTIIGHEFILSNFLNNFKIKLKIIKIKDNKDIILIKNFAIAIRKLKESNPCDALKFRFSTLDKPKPQIV